MWHAGQDGDLNFQSSGQFFGVLLTYPFKGPTGEGDMAKETCKGKSGSPATALCRRQPLMTLPCHTLGGGQAWESLVTFITQ